MIKKYARQLVQWSIFSGSLGFVVGLIVGPSAGLRIGLCNFLFVLLLMEITFKLHALMIFFLLRLFLWFQGSFPWKAAFFLDLATERLLLRKITPGYFFGHRLLQDYFADLDETDL